MTTLKRLSGDEVKQFSPQLYPAIIKLGETAESAGLEPELLELSNLRASQINGCAYCVHYHISNLREMGVPAEKIDLVVVWEETGIFSDRESAVLLWTEELTRISETRVSDSTYARVNAILSDQELVALTAAVSTINVWNRLSISFRFPPEV